MALDEPNPLSPHGRDMQSHSTAHVGTDKPFPKQNPKFKGCWVPAEVFYMLRRGEITASELALLITIHSLAECRGDGCYATNRTLAQDIGLSCPEHVSRMIAKLIDLKLVILDTPMVVKGVKTRSLITMMDTTGRAATPKRRALTPLSAERKPPLSAERKQREETTSLHYKEEENTVAHASRAVPARGDGHLSDDNGKHPRVSAPAPLLQPEDKGSPRQVAERLAQYMRSEMKRAGVSPLKKPKFETWTKQFLALFLDNPGRSKTEAQIKATIKFVYDNWKNRFVAKPECPKTLADKWVSVQNSMENHKNPTGYTKDGKKQGEHLADHDYGELPEDQQL